MSEKIQTDSIMSIPNTKDKSSSSDNQNSQNTQFNVSETESIDLEALTQAEVQNISTQSNDDSSDDMTGVALDFGEEVAQSAAERASQFFALWASNGKNLLNSLDISLTGAERISSAAFRALRVLPVVSLIVPPAWETFKYGVLEDEGTEGIINHKYEISMAAVGGVASAAVMGIVLASNPAGWVIAGTVGLCMVGSVALENFGAYLDNNTNEIPIDYNNVVDDSNNVYFY